MHEPRSEERRQRLAQFADRLVHNGRKQSRGELAPDDRADLHIAPRRAKPVEALSEEVGQAFRQVRSARAVGRVEHHARHFLDEQRHAIGALDDAVDVDARKAGAEADRLCETGGILGREAVEMEQGHIVALHPFGLRAGTGGRDQEQARLAACVDELRDEIARSRIGPVQVLVDEDERRLSRLDHEKLK